MHQYLTELAEKKEPGLYLLASPTSSGKSYHSSRVLFEKAKERKSIYVTTLTKNLTDMERDLKNLYGTEEEYRKNVVRLYSIEDNLKRLYKKHIRLSKRMEKDEKILKAYRELINACDNYFFRQDLTDSKKQTEREEMLLAEHKFRNVIRAYYIKLNKARKNNMKSNRKSIIQDIKRENPWILEMYPDMYAENCSIVLMTATKLLTRTNTLLFENDRYLSQKYLKGKFVIMDEFDSFHEDFLRNNVESAIRSLEDYIMLFQVFRKHFNKEEVKHLSKDLSDAMPESKYCNFATLFSMMEHIEKTYFLNYTFRYPEMTHSNVYLFNDGVYHTFVQNSKEKNDGLLLRCKVNKGERHIDLVPEKEDGPPLYGLLREIHQYFRYFQHFLLAWAKNYESLINEKPGRDLLDRISTDIAVETILDCLMLNSSQMSFFKDSLAAVQTKTEDSIFRDLSFYNNGFEFFYLKEKNTEHTSISMISLKETPEKLMLFIIQNATVVGLSATAEIKTVLSNFDLEYLKEHAIVKYTPKEVTERIRKEMNAMWMNYGKIQIEAMPIRKNHQTFLPQNVLDEIGEGGIGRRIIGEIEEPYAMQRYTQIIQFAHALVTDPKVHSFLYLGTKLPDGSKELNENALIRDFNLICKHHDVKGTLFVLRKFQFEETKNEIINRLENGEKVLILSSYNTLGVGHNMKYPIPKGLETICLKDGREYKKDLDGIYLDDINHVVTDFSSGISEKELVLHMEQVCALRECDEISYKQKERIMQQGFDSLWKPNFIKNGIKESSSRSVNLTITKMFVQALGRLSRSVYKNEKIVIFISETILKNLDYETLQNMILSPEIETVLRLQQAPVLPQKNEYLHRSERYATQTYFEIRRLLKENWVEATITIWKLLRKIALRYPTISEETFKTLPAGAKILYVSSGEKLNQYWYRQLNDFQQINLSFEHHTGYQEVSEKDCFLDSFMKNERIKNFFEESGYATSFQKNDYVLNPVMYHNIYKGALGEAIGAFIFKEELGINLEEITECDIYEYFDYRYKGYYFDFKNWKSTYKISKKKLRKKNAEKLEAVKGKKVFIINLLDHSSDHTTEETADGKQIEIKGLLKKDGTLSQTGLNDIKRRIELC